MTQPLNVLFLCTHNSARSIVAECVINRLGNGRFKGFSAGSQPSGRVHPYAMQLLDHLNYDTRALRSNVHVRSCTPGKTMPWSQCLGRFFDQTYHERRAPLRSARAS